MADTASLNRAEPWGAKPRRALSGRNIMLYGTLLVADTVRPESAGAVAELHRLGLDVQLLTGDNSQIARSVAAQVGIDTVTASVTPETKLQTVRVEQGAGHIRAQPAVAKPLFHHAA